MVSDGDVVVNREGGLPRPWTTRLVEATHLDLDWLDDADLLLRRGIRSVDSRTSSDISSQRACASGWSVGRHDDRRRMNGRKEGRERSRRWHNVNTNTSARV
jgi:hypothetical protein